MTSTARMPGAAHWFALALAALVLACGAAQQQPQRQQQQIVSQEPAESPYLLVTSYLQIYKMPLNGTGLQRLVTDSGISAVAFHYRLGLIFWINSRERCIKKANMDGTGIMVIAMGDISNPADLAVDWIHDKLYWSDSGLKRIEELDIKTNRRRIVVQLDSNSSPLGLAIYPTVEHGVLYWTDNGNRNLQRIVTTGSSHAVIHQNLDCVQPLALNLRQKMVYWTSSCLCSIESVFINGTNHEFVVEGDPTSVKFPQGMAQFDDTVYWVQPTQIYKKTGQEMTLLYQSISSQVLQDIQVVHPNSQPTIEQLQQPDSPGSDVEVGCGNGCENGGQCIFPGFCECASGWGGLNCSEDEDECQINNGGCSDVCINTDGGFHCSCPEGYTLSQNGTNCTESSISPTSILEILQTETNLPSLPPTHPSLTVEPNVQPTVLVTSPHVPPSPPTESTTTDTENVSPTRTTTSTHSPHISSTTDTFEVDSTSSTNASPTPSVRSDTTTTDYPYPSSTPVDNRETTTKVTDGNDVVATSSPSATKSVEPDIQQTPLMTSDPNRNMGTSPTISGLDKANNDEESNPLVFIIPVAVVAGFVLLSLAVFMFMMTYVHCRNHRQGSYSFANPAILDIAGEIPTNTIKRGQVSRTSFRQIGSTPNAPETVAILSQPRDNTHSSSTISGSESFEWNNQ